MKDLLLLQLLRARVHADARLPELLEAFAGVAIRDRVPYFGWLADLALDEAAPTPARAKALACMTGATGWIAVECAVQALDCADLIEPALGIMRVVAEHAPARWIHVAFHPDERVRRAAYATPRPAKAAMFDVALLADPSLAPDVLRARAATTTPLEEDDVPTLIELVRSGKLATASARELFKGDIADTLANALGSMRARTDEIALEGLERAIEKGVPEELSKHVDDIETLLEILPPETETWMNAYLALGLKSAMRARVASSAWVVMARTNRRAEGERLIDLLVMLEPRALKALPREEARAALIRLNDRPWVPGSTVETVNKLVLSDLAKHPSGGLDLAIVAALLRFLPDETFARAIEWLSTDAIVAAIDARPESAAAFLCLEPKGTTTAAPFWGALSDERRPQMIARCLTSMPIARIEKLGASWMHMKLALLEVGQIDDARATAIATHVVKVFADHVFGAALGLLAWRDAGAGGPSLLLKALLRELALALETAQFVSGVLDLDRRDLIVVLKAIAESDAFPLGKELALAHALAGDGDEPSREWARSRLPVDAGPEAMHSPDRAAVGVAYRKVPFSSVEAAVALLASADPAEATDMAFASWGPLDGATLASIEKGLVNAFAYTPRALSPLGHAWLWRWDAHALAHLELLLAAHATLAEGVRARLALSAPVLREASLDAIASAVSILVYRDRPRIRALVTKDLADALVAAIPTDAGRGAVETLRKLHGAGEIDLSASMPAIRAMLPDLSKDIRDRLATIIDSTGLAPRRVPRAAPKPDDESAALEARARTSTDTAFLVTLLGHTHPSVVHEATLRLIEIGETGLAALVDQLALAVSFDAVEPIVASIPLWPEGNALTRLRSALATGEGLPEIGFRIAMAFLERGDGGAASLAIERALLPTEPGWFARSDWEKLAAIGSPRAVARALATSVHAHAHLPAVDLLLTGDPSPEDLDALRAFLQCGTERMGSQRRRAAAVLLARGDTSAFPLVMATSLEDVKGRSTLFASADSDLAAQATKGALAAGVTFAKDTSIVHHLAGMPLDRSEAAFEIVLDRAVSDKARITAARYLGNAITRERKLLRVVKTFAWGVRTARRLLGKPMRVKMTGSQSLGFTRTRENVLYITPLPILRGDRQGAEIVEALIVHEIGHHLYHAGAENEAIWDKAEKDGIGGLLNLVADEHLERNMRALDAEHGDRLKRLAAYAFQHTKRMLPVRSVLNHLGPYAVEVLPTAGLGVARDQDSVLIETGSLLFRMEKAGLSFSRFARALRMGLGNRHNDPKVAEALALFGPSFKSSTMADLRRISDRLREIFGWETSLCDSFGAHECLEDAGADVESLVWGDGLSQEEVDSLVRRVTERTEGPSAPGTGGLAINVAEDEKFDLIKRIEKKPFDRTLFAPYARRVHRPASVLRRYFEELGLSFKPERMRTSGRRIDQQRLLPLVLHQDPRLLVSREKAFARDLFLGVVIDCSGSMATRDNMERAKLFAALLAEATAPLSGVDTRVFGFTDQVIYDCGDARRCAVQGLHAGGGNNDAAALYYAATVAKASQRKAKVLVMVSDGLPTECTVKALRGLVKRLTQRERMVCAQVAVQALAEVCFPHYVVLNDASIEATVTKFGTIIARLVERAISSS